MPKSNSLNETILFPTTTRIQTASILTEFDENLKLDERLLTLKCNYNSLKICGALWD